MGIPMYALNFETSMNICFVLPYFADRFGGPVTVVKNIGRRINENGHSVSYWATSGQSDSQEWLAVEDAHIFSRNWPHSWHRSTALARGLSERIASFDIMHISAMWLHPTYAASRIARGNRLPYILRPAGCLEPWRLRNTPLKWLKKKAYLKLLGKSIMGRAACVHAASAQEGGNFRGAGYRCPVTVIPNGVDTEEFTSGDGCKAEGYWPELKERPVVLFMSRLSPEKGLDILVPAWAEIVKSRLHKDALLVIAGPDDRGYQKRVEAMIDRCNLASDVCMTGMVRGSKKLALLRRADIFVLPSYSENFGIVVAEALACGAPVITTTETPWEQVRQVDAGRCIPPRRHELVQAMRELLDMSTSQRKAMGQRGRNLVEKDYSWDAIVDKFLAVCNCILDGKPIPFQP